MSRTTFRALTAAAALLLAGCTVEPLANARNDTAVASGSGFATSRALARSVTVDPVSTRVAQQVRNSLLFALHGGSPPVNPEYRVQISATASDTVLAIRSEVLAPTAAKVTLTTSYSLIEIASGQVVANGGNTTVAAYDRTSQSFANSRARRDAEDRAAKQSAERVQLALARDLVAR
ncbi:MAG: LPS assembly lipoprotein LptE [Pseudomonadota bacterium]